jgi:hypothetical protein
MMREEIKDHVLISALSGSVTPGEDTWLIDSGASKHMTGQRNILSCISEKKFSQKVTLGDDYQYPIKGVGESNHKLNSGNSLKMKEVLYVPGLKKNLLSISALEKKGFRVAFIDGEVLMWAKGETLNEAIVIGNEENGLYKLKGHSEVAMTHAIENSCELWHRRLSHINYKALPYICKAVTGLPELKGDHKGICSGCAQGKNIKNPFLKRDRKTEGVLELIHSDVCGPMPSSSIKILRSDNGGEYTSKEFVNFCKDVGIKRELTTPYNPQQNSAVERKNRTILEAVKTMIHDQDLPMCLWEEAAMAAVYVQNRLSHSALGLKTPEEMFTRKKPEVSHLKIFGYPVFIHIPKEKRNKLDPSGKKGIFVGYCEVSKAFKIYIPGHHHIEISRDVTFDEDAALKKSNLCQLEEVYEEETIIPSTAMREVPRAAEPAREVVTSPDEELLEDHDIVEVQEPPHMTILHKRKPAWARELIQDGEKYGVPQGTTRQVKRLLSTKLH